MSGTIEKLKSAYEAAEAAYHAALIDAYPFKVGDRIVNYKGKRGVVSYVRIRRGYYKVEAFYQLIKKDGTPGVLWEMHEWDKWQIDTPATGEAL